MDSDSIPGEEIWRAVQGFEGIYEVSSFGRLKRLPGKFCPNERIQDGRIGASGYWKHDLTHSKKTITITAHRLVADAFLGPRPFEGAEVAHADGDKLNNRLSNLRYASPAENAQDEKRLGRKPSAKITAEQVMWFRADALQGKSVNQIAKANNVKWQVAHNAIYGRTFAGLVSPFSPLEMKQRKALNSND